MASSRPYRSQLRDERARETRLRVRRSARDLFAAQGVAGTTLAQIAEGAGVSQQTVYAVFGSKAGIVRAMLEEMEEAADEASWVARILAEDDPRQQLRLFVSLNRALFEGGAPILRALMAARSEPAVAEVAERGDRKRREGASRLVGLLAGKGVLRDGLKPGEAADRLWLLTSAEQYVLATDDLGWSPARYERWLGGLLEAELLDGAGPA
jgi:AcrR family transcriptional regulator